MKRLVLMGGRPWLAADGGAACAAALFRYAGKSPKLAFCIFAQPESDWHATEQANTAILNANSGGRHVTYRTMTPQNVTEVSNWADIIYVPGGNSHVLKEKLASIPGLAALWDGKLVAGSSAGAVTLCERYIYLQDKTFGQGLGWVKASCIPHWRDAFETYTDDDWDWAEEQMTSRYPDLPVLCIPEGKYVEITIP